jgi:hypothetical protein
MSPSVDRGRSAGAFASFQIDSRLGEKSMRADLRLVGLCAALVAGLAGPARAITIVYDSDVAPDALAPDPFTFKNNYASTSWSVASGELTLNTTLGTVGIWFGNGDHIAGLEVPWDVATNEQGNYVKIRMKLTPGSKDWSSYLYDQSHSGGFGFDDDQLTLFSTGVPTEPLDIDLTEYHTFEYLIRDGMVSYRLDESLVLYHGPGGEQSFGVGILVIGDGSASTVSGTGSMIIDHVTYMSEPAFDIPEPATAGLAAIMGAGLLARRRAGVSRSGAGFGGGPRAGARGRRARSTG